MAEKEDLPADEVAEIRADVARKLLLGNPVDKLDVVCVTLSKVIGNIIADPNNPKKRQLRMSNAQVQNRILRIPGGQHYLEHVCGFEIIGEDERTRVLRLTDSIPATDLAPCKTWIDKILTARQTTHANARQLPDCVIRLMMPDGGFRSLGFGKDEPLSALYDMVDAVFYPNFPFWLATRHPHRKLDLGDLVQSFAEHEFVPKTVLAIVPTVKEKVAFKEELPASSSSALIRTKLKQQEQRDAIYRREQAKKHAIRAKEKAKANREHRARVLRDFHEDRENVAQKLEIAKRKRIAQQEQQEAEAKAIQDQLDRNQASHLNQNAT